MKAVSRVTPYNRAMDSRAIGVFDSGMGGLTVLHECLVTLPQEDFVYLGDGARFPYGPRPLDELRRYAARDRRLPRGRGREADRGRVQLGHLGGAARAADRARRARDRRAHARGARGRAGDAQPPGRPPRHAGDGRERALRGARPHARRRCRPDPGRVPAARAADRERRPVRARDDRGRARVRRAAQARRRGHGDPRLHALPADPADPPARVRPRRDPRLLGRGDRARDGRDARAQGDRERAGTRGRLPLPHHRRPRGVPRRWAGASCSCRSTRSSTWPSPSWNRRRYDAR